MKKCAKCGIEKDESFFYKNTRNKDGYHSYCKECNKKAAQIFNKTDKGIENVKRAQKKQFESGYFRFGPGAIHNMTQSAMKRGLEFNLTADELKSWWLNTKDICYYCGTEISEYLKIRDFITSYAGSNWEIYRFKKFFKLSIHTMITDMTIDRVDNSRGYVKENIVKACWICNSQKSDFYTGSEMKVIGTLIIDNIKSKIQEEE